MTNNQPRSLIAIATFNEIENLPTLVTTLLDLVPSADILVVDDNSPDGTGDWCDRFAKLKSRLRCIHRAGKLGLGSATIEAFQYALDNRYELVATMDADFSHDPNVLPRMFETIIAQTNLDVLIGSRYIDGGGIEGWPLFRRLGSRVINGYVRFMLGLETKDNSGAFRVYRTTALDKIDLGQIRSNGYAYLEEILWRLKQKGCNFAEFPFIFRDRQRGKSKINLLEAAKTFGLVTRLGIFKR